MLRKSARATAATGKIRVMNGGARFERWCPVARQRHLTLLSAHWVASWPKTAVSARSTYSTLRHAISAAPTHRPTPWISDRDSPEPPRSAEVQAQTSFRGRRVYCAPLPPSPGRGGALSPPAATDWFLRLDERWTAARHCTAW